MDPHYFGSGQLVLVVDDEPDFRLAMEHLLATLGLRSIFASNGEEALARLGREEVSVLLTDLYMPRMDGLELIRHLKQNQSAPPIIAVTGDARIAPEAMTKFARSLGAKAVLLKPFSRDQLAEVLAFVLGKTESKFSESGYDNG